MGFTSPYPLETRQGVEALLQQSGLTMRQIAERSGVSYPTVKLWNRQARIRPWTRVARCQVDPRDWTLGRTRAAARLFGQAEVEPGDLAEALGAPRSEASALMLACGLAAATARPTLAPPAEAPDLAALDLALRAHIARQIAAFDAALNRGDPAIDTGRVLRDLGGLKRLLDDLSARAGRTEAKGDADGESPEDVAAARDRIARRYEAFAAERPHAGFSAAPGSVADREAGA